MMFLGATDLLSQFSKPALGYWGCVCRQRRSHATEMSKMRQDFEDRLFEMEEQQREAGERAQDLHDLQAQLDKYGHAGLTLTEIHKTHWLITSTFGSLNIMLVGAFIFGILVCGTEGWISSELQHCRGQ